MKFLLVLMILIICLLVLFFGICLWVIFSAARERKPVLEDDIIVAEKEPYKGGILMS